ncbi:hypothetical protein SBDP1_520007 [Syntrophobacter sp. SbD1]|nr:hypothetical protein SBDP1_520007 [Syntrophobacter sp. SbD1]
MLRFGINTSLLCIESVMSCAPFRDADHILNEVIDKRDLLWVICFTRFFALPHFVRGLRVAGHGAWVEA